MSDYEHIVVSAVRYALGRMTYIVGITVDYVMKEIADNKLSKKYDNVYLCKPAKHGITEV